MPTSRLATRLRASLCSILRYPRKRSVQRIAIAGPRRLTVTPGPGSDLSWLAGIALVISAFWHHRNWPCETLLADGTRAGRRDPPSSSAAPRHPEGKPTRAHILQLHRQHGERQESGR